MVIADVAEPPFKLWLQGYLTSLGLLTLPQCWELSRAPCACSLEAVSHSVSIAQDSANTTVSVIQGLHGQRSLSLLEKDRHKLEACG